MQKTLMVYLIILTFNLNCSMKEGMNKYNKVVKYNKNEKLQFEDLTLEFTGIKEEKSEFENGNHFIFRMYEFTVNSNKSQKAIQWSSGTGDIAPLRFEFEGKQYELELSYSEKLKKWLSVNELVIVK